MENSVQPISGSLPTVPTPNGAAGQSAAATALAGDFETFLTLLTSQLRNQDPLKPLDSTEFVAQLASFSAVEQQINTNKKLDDLLSAITGSGIDEAARLIGKSVNAAGSRIEIEKSGEVPVHYELPDGATEAKLRITDATGRVVRELPLDLQSRDLIWDGKNTAGLAVPPGRYDLSIAALKDGEDLTGGNLEISGVVDEAHIGGGEIKLVLDNGLAILPGDVRVIRAAGSAVTNGL